MSKKSPYGGNPTQIKPYGGKPYEDIPYSEFYLHWPKYIDAIIIFNVFNKCGIILFINSCKLLGIKWIVGLYIHLWLLSAGRINVLEVF